MNNYDCIKLENQLCFPFYAISREIIKLYKPALDQHHLTYTQYICMLVLWEEEAVTFKKLGEKLYLDSGTLTPVLKKLETMNLINKYRTKEDDRMVMVELTKEGRALKEKITNVPAEVGSHIQMEKEELIQLKQLLDKMLKQLK